MSGDLRTVLAGLYTGIVYDVLRARGVVDHVLPPEIGPVVPGQVLVGEIFTVEGAPDPDIDPHESLLAWTQMLSDVPSGRVVVCQPNDAILAHMGELSAETLAHRGVLGYVVDGGCRDTTFITRIGFPVWCRYRTPVDIVGRWRVGTLGATVRIGGVDISSGDWLIADDDGVVVIPQAIARDVVEEAARQAQTENLVRKAILEGVRPRDAYERHGKF